MVAGTNCVQKYSRIELMIMMMLPISMKGRNLPNLPLVLSINAPMMGSVTASNRRMIVTIVLAKTTARPRTPP